MPGTRREKMKLETRKRVMQAARQLFSEKGYAASTIRDIATLADVSTGSVFTTFESKEDILSTIVLERQEELSHVIAKARSEAKGDARAQLKAAIRAAYGYELDRLPMVVDQIGASWNWSRELEQRSRPAIAKSFSFIRDILLEAQAEGVLHPQVDMEILGDLILGAYLRNYRHIWFRNWSTEQLFARMDAQVDMIFDGAAATPMTQSLAARKKA